MNPPELTRLARSLDLENEVHFVLRVAFGLACAERVEHRLTDPSVVACLAVGKAFVRGECGEQEVQAAAVRASELARSHPGSGSIDGTGSAAVSVSHAVAAALAGRALVAAGYAAYASVYAYASHAASDPAAYAGEHAWQVQTLRRLAKIAAAPG